jgi:hypothetical protein
MKKIFLLGLLSALFACQSSPSIDGCYTNEMPATADAPTSSKETLEIKVTGDQVSGTTLLDIFKNTVFSSFQCL